LGGRSIIVLPEQEGIGYFCMGGSIICGIPKDDCIVLTNAANGNVLRQNVLMVKYYTKTHLHMFLAVHTALV
jgi:hypothetical protein